MNIEEGATLDDVQHDLMLQDDAYIHVDVYKVEQVIRNLITNAVGPVPQKFLSTTIVNWDYSQD